MQGGQNESENHHYIVLKNRQYGYISHQF